MEEHVVENAEDDRASSDAESQGEDGDQGEMAIFPDVAEGVAEVAGETIETVPRASAIAVPGVHPPCPRTERRTGT